MRIAMVGSGISGLLAARLLAADHEVHVFEANDYAGGHTNTVSFDAFGRQYAADTGFMVFNDRTYPNFIRMLRMLDVPARNSDMSFSVRCDCTGLEYQGSSLNGLFAQRRNLLRPSFYRMLLDVLRFNRRSLELLQGEGFELTLGAYLERGRYGREFIEHYLVPMGAAIWSAAPETVVAEVTNTPWLERHWYVLDAGNRAAEPPRLRFRHPKGFHVSPFMDMDQEYQWRLTAPGPQLTVTIVSSQRGARLFDVGLSLRRRELGRRNVLRTLLRYPWMTARVTQAIYWQALRLRGKRCPFYPHPKHRGATQSPPT